VLFLLFVFIEENNAFGSVSVRVKVFSTTFNNKSAVSWWSVLFVEETRVPGENHDMPQIPDKL
jgi:hypothetical protein